MFHGSYDPSAGFLIERYNSKRQRIKFPDIPRTQMPWICPINSNGAGASSAGSSSRTFSNSKKAKLPESLSLDEVENTFNLFDNIVDKANTIDELKTDTCKELVYRCRIIADNMDRLSMSMDKEEELARAIKVSEKLRRTLDAYDTSIRNNELTKPIPIVNSLNDTVDSDHSRGRTTTEDEAYLTPPRGYSREKNGFNNSSHSLKSSSGRPRLPRGASSPSRFGKKSSGGMVESRSHESHLDSLNGDASVNGNGNTTAEDLSVKERREEAQKRFHREYVASKRAAVGGSSTSIKVPGHSGHMERERSASPGSRRKLERSRTSIPSSSRKKRMEDRVDSSADEEPPRRSKSTRKKELEISTDDDNYTRDGEKETRVVEKKKKSKSGKSLKKSKGSKGLGTTGAKPPRKGKDGKRRMGGRSVSAIAGPSSSNVLIDVGSGGGDTPPSRSGRRLAEVEYSSSEEETDGNQDLFARLGEKYETNKSGSDTNTVNITPEQGQLQQVPPAGQMAMYNTNPYGPMMMPMPMQPPPHMMYNSMNPMGMYNSFNPYFNPMAAYASQNPMAAYASNMGNPMAAYASHNPQMAAYASHNPMMPQFQPPPQFMQQPPQQQQMSQTPAQQTPQTPLQGSPPMQPNQQQNSNTPPLQNQAPQPMNLPPPQPLNAQVPPGMPPQAQPSMSMDQMQMNPQMPPMGQMGSQQPNQHLPAMGMQQQMPMSVPMGGPPQMPMQQMQAPPAQPLPGMFPPSGDSFGGMQSMPSMQGIPSMQGMPPMAPMAPPPPPPPAAYTTVTNAPLPPPNAPPPPGMAQAAMYQQTMANAAAMYQAAAAAAYQSVHNQPPLQVNANTTPAPPTNPGINGAVPPPPGNPANPGNPAVPVGAPAQPQQTAPQVTEPPTTAQ